MTPNRLTRWLGTLAALGLVAGTTMLTATSAQAVTVTCPAVDSSTGAVTPAPSAGVDWAGCDLASAYMAGADLDDADLQDADLSSAYVTNASLASANLAGATLTDATVSGSNFAGADLSSATFTDTFADSTDMNGADLDGVSAFGGNFIAATLTSANLQAADLSYANLQSADLFGATTQGATSENATWTNAICPSGASANYYADGCLSAVSVTTPAATPTVTAGTMGLNDWYTSAVTVSWYWADSNSLASANCPASTTTSVQGADVTISASCTDASGNVGHASITVAIDTTPPQVSVRGVRAGAVYSLGEQPMSRCVTTDALSGVRLYAGDTTSGGRPDGTGVLTVTCSGAEDEAGNIAAPVSANYAIVYDLGGFIAPIVGSGLNPSAKKITVKFRLAAMSGATIPAGTEAALAAAHDIRATLSGPGTSPTSTDCGWNAGSKYLECLIPTPRHIQTGRSHHYLITATENVGSGFLPIPADFESQDPGPVYFK
jgi:hypothetical protein